MAFTKNGTQGAAWQQMSVTISASYKQMSVYFSGSVGGSYRGDIALDDITLKDGVCTPPGKSLIYVTDKLLSVSEKPVFKRVMSWPKVSSLVFIF